jgi:hypothetical protein
MEYNADEADKTREPNNRLVGSLAHWLVGSSAHGLIGLSDHKEISLDFYIFPGTGETIAIFFHLFLLLIERQVQRRLVNLSARQLASLVGSSAYRLFIITFFNERGKPLQFFTCSFS